MHAGAGIAVQQLPGSRLVGSLVASLEVTTLAAFVQGMTPLIPDKMPEICALVACMLAAPFLQYRSGLHPLHVALNPHYGSRSMQHVKPVDRDEVSLRVFLALCAYAGGFLS